jgi:hypothetical protein
MELYLDILMIEKKNSEDELKELLKKIIYFQSEKNY